MSVKPDESSRQDAGNLEETNFKLFRVFKAAPQSVIFLLT